MQNKNQLYVIEFKLATISDSYFIETLFSYKSIVYEVKKKKT